MREEERQTGTKKLCTFEFFLNVSCDRYDHRTSCFFSRLVCYRCVPFREYRAFARAEME